MIPNHGTAVFPPKGKSRSREIGAGTRGSAGGQTAATAQCHRHERISASKVMGDPIRHRIMARYEAHIQQASGTLLMASVVRLRLHLNDSDVQF